MFGFFFGFSGRFRRGEYWLHVLIAVVIWAIVFLAGGTYVKELQSSLQHMDTHGKMPPGVVGILIGFFVFWLLMMWAAFASIAKRFHDFGSSGWSALWLLVPLVNIYFGIKIGFFRGELRDNNYGISPYTPEKVY
jgi:uncharacterized membrane protein YhaH (DUF805 family)